MGGEVQAQGGAADKSRELSPGEHAWSPALGSGRPGNCLGRHPGLAGLNLPLWVLRDLEPQLCPLRPSFTLAPSCSITAHGSHLPTG